MRAGKIDTEKDMPENTQDDMLRLYPTSYPTSTNPSDETLHWSAYQILCDISQNTPSLFTEHRACIRGRSGGPDGR